MTIVLPFILFLLNGFTSIIITNKRVLSALFIATSFTALIFGFLEIWNAGHEVSYIFGGFAREIGIEYLLNPFKSFILNFILGIVFIFSIFFHGFIRNFNKTFNFNLLFCIIQIMCGALVAIVLTNDLFNFYIFFELLAICTYILISLGGKGSSFASFNYLSLGVIASGFLVIGIGFLYFSTGYLNFTKVIEALQSQSTLNIKIPLIFFSICFLIKLGIFPFSFWVGLVYKHFPSSVLPLYSGVVALVTFFGFFTFLSKFFSTELIFLKDVILTLCILGVLVFSLFSLYETNLKKIFAYSTISQISYSLFPIFFGIEELTRSAFLHIISNVVSKSALFIILYEVTKSKTPVIHNLNDLAKKSQFATTFLIFFLASIVGVPITLGFFTKISIIFGLIKANSYLFVFIMLLGALLNFLYFWRVANVMFFKSKQDEDEDKITISIESKIAILLLFFTSIILVLYFGDISNFLDNSLRQFYQL
jgi:multicomponent Na+:H+ antiporter subunit D